MILAAAAGGWPAATTATLIVGLLTASVALMTLWVNGVRQERARLQQLYADALAAVVAYQEFPYVVRRRRAPTDEHPEIAGEERVRISEALREVQKDLAHATAWITTQSPRVAVKYEALVADTRRVAGGYLRSAWEGEPLSTDSGMNIADINYQELEAPKRAYLDAVLEALTFWHVALPWFGSDTA